MMFEESLAMRRELGHKPGIATCLYYLGVVAHAHGRLALARSLLEESLVLRQQLSDLRGAAESLEALEDITTPGPSA